jgi:DNA repair protein RadC
MSGLYKTGEALCGADFLETTRERLLAAGPEALSDNELLELFLGGGPADALREKLELCNGVPAVPELAALPGVDADKAQATAAMLEFCRRRWNFRGARVKDANGLFSLLRHYADCRQERLISVSLNGAREVLAVRVVTVGLVNKAVVHPREIFADVIIDRASAVCIAHNHPSGLIYPSREDDDVTKNIAKAAHILGIRLLDHLIFSGDEFYSYHREGKLNDPGTDAKLDPQIL